MLDDMSSAVVPVDGLLRSLEVYAPSLTVADFDGLRGIAAASDIKAGQLLFSVPFSQSFTDSELGLPLTVDSSTRLAAALLAEALSPSPRRSAHLALLPDSFPMLAGRMPTQLRREMSPTLRAMALEYDAHDAVRESCASGLSRPALAHVLAGLGM